MKLLETGKEKTLELTFAYTNFLKNYKSNQTRKGWEVELCL